MPGVERRHVRVESHGAVAVVYLDRPEARNAIDPAMSQEVAAVFRDLDRDDEVRATVLTGVGGVFCAGADLKALERGEIDGIIGIEGGFCGLTRWARVKPMVAAVNGWALAGGCELVLAADIAVAEEQARFGLPEVSHGIIAGAGGLVRIGKEVGSKRAMELVLTGRQVGAREALELGLVNYCVAEGEGLTKALEIAAKIAANAPVAIAESRAVVEVAVDHGSEAAWRRNELAWKRVRATRDSLEGPRAFAERRKPNWTGA